MPKKTPKTRRVKKSEWLEAALRALVAGGIRNVRVETLARELGVARSGFYWHFRDRQALLEEMLEHWSHELTGIVIRDPEINALPPAKRLAAISDIVSERHLAKYDAAIRQWAQQDPMADRAAREVFRMRLAFLRKLFSELGFEGDELEMRAHLFVIYASSERDTMPELSRAKRKRMAPLRVELLTRPAKE